MNEGQYTTDDFKECVGHYELKDTKLPDGRQWSWQAVRSVIAAWGTSPDGWGSWEGGFLMELHGGGFAYLHGWCDTSGWG